MGKQTARRRTRVLLPWTAALAILLFPAVAFTLLNTSSSADTGVRVIGVIDGDTLVLEGKSKVRLRHADAPELEYCGGLQAKQLLASLTKGKKVRLEEQIPDQYGRGMALVYAGSTFINLEMLQSGWARYHHDISTKEDLLKAANNAAKKEKKGIYNVCQSKENIKNPTCIIKGNKDDNSEAKKYYIPGCAQYTFTLVEQDQGEAWFCSEKEAQKAGFTKAATCP